jgi:hypothetical protein
MKQNSTRTYIAVELIIHGEDAAEKLSKTLFYLNKDNFLSHPQKPFYSAIRKDLLFSTGAGYYA